MEPPKTPAQLAAQKYEVVETFQDIAEQKGIGEAFPILTLVTNGKAPDDEPSKIEYGRAAVAAFCAEHLAFAPPADMADRPEPLLRVKFLDNVTIVDFRVYAEWEAYGGRCLSALSPQQKSYPLSPRTRCTGFESPPKASHRAGSHGPVAAATAPPISHPSRG